MNFIFHKLWAKFGFTKSEVFKENSIPFIPWDLQLRNGKKKKKKN